MNLCPALVDSIPRGVPRGALEETGSDGLSTAGKRNARDGVGVVTRRDESHVEVGVCAMGPATCDHLGCQRAF